MPPPQVSGSPPSIFNVTPVRKPFVMANSTAPDTSWRGRRGRHDVVDGTHSLGERADRCVVGDVDSFGGDVVSVVRVGELGLIPACDDDPRTFVVREQRYGTGNAAAAPDHHNGFVLQRITHRDCPSRLDDKLGCATQNCTCAQTGQCEDARCRPWP
jgi:hypothetical protein